MTSLMMTSYNGKFFKFLWHRKQRRNLDCLWLRENFLQMEHYFSSKGVLPMITSLKNFHYILLSINIFIIIKTLFFNRQTYTVNDVFVVITVQLSQYS